MAPGHPDHFTEPVRLPAITVGHPLVVTCANKYVVRWGRLAVSRYVDVLGNIRLGESNCDLGDPTTVLVPTLSVYRLQAGEVTSYYECQGFYIRGLLWVAQFKSNWVVGDVKKDYTIFDRYMVELPKDCNTPEIIRMVEKAVGNVL